MIWLNNISFTNKLIGLVVLITTSVTIAGYSIIIFRFASEQERKFVENVNTNATLLADYCVGPMSFNDSIETINVLSRIENLPEIISATVYDNDNMTFAKYVSTKHSSNANTDDRLWHIVSEEIMYKQIAYGNIKIIASRENVSSEIAKFIITNGGWLLFILFLGIFVAYRMQFIIIRPLLRLMEVSKRISQEADYSVRLHREGKDEIAAVYSAFNNMLEQIEKRDEARNEVELNLQKAKERAEHADYLKTSFLTNMSHEIRTPMNAILGFTALLIEEDLPRQQRKDYLKVINESGNTLLNLVNDILDISKIEAGQLTIVWAACDINELLNELYISFNEIKTQKKKTHIQIIVKNPYVEKSLQILTDPFRLKQVMTNLIGNALKFTDEGNVEFGVSIIANQIEFYVKDTGIGINDAHLDDVFQRFRKIDEEKSRLYRGAGLGLAICRDIVRLLGGEITVTSELGEGSLFKFAIPLKTVETRNKNLINQDPLNSASGIDLSGKIILVAEDEPNNFKFLNQLLQRYNATMVWARNGEEAIRQTAEQTFDLVLMDLKMPKIDGYEATRIIKRFYPSLPIIAQTAYTNIEEVNKCYDAGCDYYISKPIQVKELEKTLRKIWDN